MSVGKRRAPLRASGPPERRTRVKPVNRERKASEFARCYHSKARVAWVKSLACAACGMEGYSENAHVLGNDGMSRKAGFETVAPLCGLSWFRDGCHHLFDVHPDLFAKRNPNFNPEQAAVATQAAWSAHLHQQTGAGTT